jgi:hypothetical protein
MSRHLLNDDGTVNLHAAEHALAEAEKACTEAFREARRAEVAAYAIPSFRIEHGRALIRLDVARSNAEGAFEAVQRARGLVDEALNPGN